MEGTLLLHLGIALGLGLLVGLQRERVASQVAGIRTFTLITLLGVLTATLALHFGGWTYGAGLLAVALYLVVGNVLKLRAQEEVDPGMTTEVAALVMFGVGGALVLGYTSGAVVVGGGVAVLLQWKEPLHTFTERLGEADVQALVRLVLVGLVILPVLPNRSFGPYEVLNPFEIWLMVVLIVGISMAGYVAFRLLGPRSGTLVAGVLGGLISSTATTIGYARRANEHPDRAPAAALVIVLASTVVFLRVLVEIAVVAPRFLATTALPLAAMMVLMIGVAGLLFWKNRTGLRKTETDREAPSDLRAAIIFGVLYAVVLFAVAAARTHFGQKTLYGVAALSGLTDMDAITLSTAQLMKAGELEVSTGWRLILVGGMANLVFKGGAVAVLGNRALLGRVAAAFGLSLVGGGAILAFWPG